MRKLTYTAFVAFVASVSTVLVLALLAPAPERDGLPGDTAAGAEYTLAEVARHSSDGSCWLAIEEDVYDLTAYLPQHPAPPQVLFGWCGREATEGMRTKGYGRDHSQAAWALLDRYRIGALAD